MEFRSTIKHPADFARLIRIYYRVVGEIPLTLRPCFQVRVLYFDYITFVNVAVNGFGILRT